MDKTSEMKEALPIIIELLENPSFVANANDTGYQFDPAELLRLFEVLLKSSVELPELSKPPEYIH